MRWPITILIVWNVINTLLIFAKNADTEALDSLYTFRNNVNQRLNEITETLWPTTFSIALGPATYDHMTWCVLKHQKGEPIQRSHYAHTEAEAKFLMAHPEMIVWQQLN